MATADLIKISNLFISGGEACACGGQRTLVGEGSFLPLCRSWGLSSGCQTWHKLLLLTELSL